MNLFDEFEIKGRKIKNRIGLPALVCYDWTGADGKFTEKSTAHYEEIAKGGVGFICTEACAVSSDARVCGCAAGIWDNSQIDGLAEIVKAVHKYDIPIVVQLQHSGLVGYGDAFPPINYLPEGINPFVEKNGSTIYTKAPSEYTTVFGFDGLKRVSSELTIDEIHTIQKQFIDAAVRAYKAGADGVELHACHFYLICQFLNSRVNKRTDEYGKIPEKFCLEIINGIREKTPDNFIIGIRLGIFEPTLDDGIHHAVVFEKAGVDYLHMSFGFQSESDEYKPDDYPFNQYIFGAEEIKKAVSIPVFAVNGIDTPELAQKILDATGVDMCFVGAGQLVNPNWANDAKNGKDVGRCLKCKFCFWRAHPDKCGGRKLYEKNKERCVL